MAKNDYAIVVGISCYPDPDFGNLKSPEHDAQAFFDWLTDSGGGGVPEANIDLILTSKYNPPFPSRSDALPTTAEVQRALDRLHERARNSGKAGNGMRIGRRLYLFFSGHGFGPEDNEAAVFMANVDRLSMAYHILGKYNADWFLDAACFDEVLLFMDCCRQRETISALNKPYASFVDETARDRVKVFYAFATKWNRKTRERAFGEMTRGVFTTALLTGLKGAAAGSDGVITNCTLYDYLTQHMGEFMNPEDRDDPNISNQPDIHPRAPDPPGFVIASVTSKPTGFLDAMIRKVRPAKPEAPTFAVVVRASGNSVGKSIQFLDHEFKPAGDPVKAAAETRFDLPHGIYLLRVESVEQPITVEVTGAAGEVDVRI